MVNQVFDETNMIGMLPSALRQELIQFMYKDVIISVRARHSGPVYYSLPACHLFGCAHRSCIKSSAP